MYIKRVRVVKEVRVRVIYIKRVRVVKEVRVRVVI